MQLRKSSAAYWLPIYKKLNIYLLCLYVYHFIKEREYTCRHHDNGADSKGKRVIDDMNKKILSLRVLGTDIKLKIPYGLYTILSRLKSIFSRLLRRYFTQSRLSNLEKRRESLSNQLAISFDFTVRYGIFKGVKLSENFNWSKSDIAPMLLGTYEQQIVEYISKIPIKIKYFINVGAGDGYYVAGMLHSRLADFAFAYEMNKLSREAILNNMALNRLEGRFEIKGMASSNFLDDFSSSVLENSLLLVDIEGYEFELFEKIKMSQLRHTYIVIEIHDFDGESTDKVEDLLSLLANTHSISVLTTGSRNLDNYVELANFHDNDRWLIVSEGRPSLMKWVCCEPK